VDRLDPADRAALIAAAERGNLASVDLMLELGFPIEARREGIDDDGATALQCRVLGRQRRNRRAAAPPRRRPQRA
jgi:hypothetical protein